MDISVQISDQGREAALAGVLAQLLDLGIAARCFLPQYDADGTAVYGTLVNSSAQLARSACFAPYINGNKGREAGMISGGTTAQCAIVLRPCEARAFIELSKLKQATRESSLLITMDCPGTFALADYKTYLDAPGTHVAHEEALYDPFRTGTRTASPQMRECCLRCESLAHDAGDISVLLCGTAEGQLVLRSHTDSGEAALTRIAAGDQVVSIDTEVRAAFTAQQRAQKDTLQSEWGENISSISDFLALLRHCRRCYNCRAECPICYCRECVFQTATFDVSADTFAQRATRFGTVKMPPDTLVFHLTRLNHMATSCVACGQCTEACPQGIPVGSIFSAVSARVQELFDYTAGVSPEDAPPLTVYKEEELQPR